MLKHCSFSRLDVRGSNPNIVADKTVSKKEKVIGLIKNKLIEEIRARDPLERRLSVSLMYIDQERGNPGATCIAANDSVSSRYRQRLRKHSLSQSLDGEASRVTFESIRVYAKCLRSDIEYRTVKISKTTTASQVIMGLLDKYKLKHFDRNMFFLTMEVT